MIEIPESLIDELKYYIERIRKLLFLFNQSNITNSFSGREIEYLRQVGYFLESIYDIIFKEEIDKYVLEFFENTYRIDLNFEAIDYMVNGGEYLLRNFNIEIDDRNFLHISK